MTDRLTAMGGPAWRRLAAGLHQAGAVDRAVYEAIASVPTPELDGPFQHLPRAADKSRLWLAIAAGLAIAGAGQPGRLSGGRCPSRSRRRWSTWASSPSTPVGGQTALVLACPANGTSEMPASTSFPSGHSASAFAFASSVGRDLPRLALALNFLAAAVACSRVHTGVHYPGDTIVGAVIGASTAQTLGTVIDRHVPALRP